MCSNCDDDYWYEDEDDAVIAAEESNAAEAAFKVNDRVIFKGNPENVFTVIEARFGAWGGEGTYYNLNGDYDWHPEYIVEQLLEKAPIKYEIGDVIWSEQLAILLIKTDRGWSTQASVLSRIAAGGRSGVGELPTYDDNVLGTEKVVAKITFV